MQKPLNEVKIKQLQKEGEKIKIVRSQDKIDSTPFNHYGRLFIQKREEKEPIKILKYIFDDDDDRTF